MTEAATATTAKGTIAVWFAWDTSCAFAGSSVFFTVVGTFCVFSWSAREFPEIFWVLASCVMTCGTAGTFAGIFAGMFGIFAGMFGIFGGMFRSEEHTSELQSHH